VRIIILPSYNPVSTWTADFNAQHIRTFNLSILNLFILKFPSAASLFDWCRELIAIFKKGFISFNMDESVGL